MRTLEMSRPMASKITQQEPARQEGASSPAYSIQPAPTGPRAAILALQRTAGNRAVSQWLQSTEANSALDGEGSEARLEDSLSRLPVMLQTKSANGPSGNPAEQQADRAAAAATHQPETEAPARALIVEDEAEQVQSGQMRKSEFLSALKSSVCSAAEEALRGTIWSAMGCPYIERWLSHYSNQSSQHVERAMRKYAPETASVRTAREYIPLITQRVQRGIAEWARTGEVTGVPEELAQGGMPGVSAAGLMGGLVSGALSAVGSAVSGLVSGAGRALSGAARALFKGREGGAREAAEPAAVQSQLGSSHSLDGGVKAQMESAFGVNFSGVRVHTDATAQELSDRLNARAFTIGSDIAFSSGEYQPGTLIGDALIAHELAHVVQQGRANPSAAPMQKGGAEHNSLEEDADVSAVGAVVSVWGGAKGALKQTGENALPRLRSGLRLQRCSRGPTYDFELYRTRFNRYWNDPAFNTLPTSFDPELPSKGPRTTRAREIFNRIYREDTALRVAYDANASGVRDRIDTYAGPEGLNIVVGAGGEITESPRLQTLRAAFERFDKPVSSGDYASLSTAVRNASRPLEEPERRAVENSNDWQRLMNDYVRSDAQRSEIRTIIATRPPAPGPPPPPPAPPPPPSSGDAAQTFVDGITISGPTAPVLANGRDEQVTLTPHSTVNNPSVVVETRFTVTPANRVRDTNVSPASKWPIGTADGVPFQPRIINTSDVTMNAHLDLVNGVSAPVRATPIQDLQFRVQDNRLANFRANWRIRMNFNSGGGAQWWTSGATVRYRGGTQVFNVEAFVADPLTNPGLILFVRAQILRGSEVVVPSTALTPFPPDQSQSPRLAMAFSAPGSVPATGDMLTVQVELLGADRTTLVDPPKTITLAVLPEVTFTQAQAEAAAAEDDAFFRSGAPTGLRGMMTAQGGVAANVVEAIDSGRVTMTPITMRHDSSAYVTEKNGGRPDPSKDGYFAGTHYTPTAADPNSFVGAAGAAAFSRRPGDIVMNRTLDVSTNDKRSADGVISLTIHEAVHALDIRPHRDRLIERYKTEFRAYWMDGRFGPPDKGSCPSSAPPGCTDTTYDPTMPPPGPKSPRARAIFRHLYGSVTYDFVKPAYDNNTDGFRAAVDNYLIPDGINLRVSLRLEALRNVIESWSGSDFDAFRARVRRAAAATDPDDWNEITRNRAWRDLVERKVTDIGWQRIIKSDLGIRA